MPDYVKAVLTRLVGAAVAGAATYAASKWDFVIPDEAKSQLTATGVTVLITIFTTVYAATHKTAEAKVPGLQQSTKA